MIEGMIQKLVIALTDNELIAESEMETYMYSMLCFTESSLTIGSILFLGFFIGKLFPTICFCSYFLLLRHRT